jgi:hypothetical protein
MSAAPAQQRRSVLPFHLPRLPPRLLAALLLALAVLAGAWLQWHWRAAQSIDIGSTRDSGYVHYFSARETSTADPALRFRWSQRWSRLYLWPLPPGRPAVLHLRMRAPPQPEGPQRTQVSAAGRVLADVPVSDGFRRYALLLPAQERFSFDITGDIILESEPLALDNPQDQRKLGVALEHVRLSVPGSPAPADLLQELWLAPLLPLGLLLLGLWALLLRMPPLLAGVLPALALAALLLAAHMLPAARLVLAAYLSTAAGVAMLVALLLWLLRRLPRLAPRSDQAAAAWMAALWALLLLASFSPLVNSDGVGYYAYLRSLTMDGDLHFANEFTAPAFSRTPWSLQPTPTGHVVNLWSVGPAICWAPLYGLAHVLVHVGQVLGIPWQANGYDSPYIVLSIFTSALAGLVIMLASYRVCRRFVGPPVALLAVVSVFLGGNLLYYTMLEGSFAHALSTAAAALYVLAWLRLEEQPDMRRWALLGVAAGALVLIYWVTALLLLLPALTAARLLLAALRSPPGQRVPQLARLLAGGLVAAALALLVFSPQMMAWYVLYGSPLTIPQGEGFVSLGSFDWREYFFSTLYGLLPWTPAFFVGMLGVALLVRQRPWLALCLLLSMGLYIWFNGSIPGWHGSSGFGLRRLTPLAPWFAVGLALLYDALRRWHAAIPATLAALLMTWASLLLVRYYLFMLPHDLGSLYKLRYWSLLLSREALPFERVPTLLTSSYFWRALAGRPFSPAHALEAAVLLAILALVLWGVLRFAGRGSAAPAVAPPREHARESLPAPRG